MQSKIALDKIVSKSRVHLYKPIQIAEILYHQRVNKDISVSDLSTYRNKSKKWRDIITARLVGGVSTSSQKFQDNLFDENAMPPRFLAELDEFNQKNKGIVEAYIYYNLMKRLDEVAIAYEYLLNIDKNSFDLKTFLSFFQKQKGLRRSIDKAYEIIVYSLFNSLVRALKARVTFSIRDADEEIILEFEDFIQLVLGLSKSKKEITMPAALYRVGVTNAADRGLDMWANYGLAIQVKHLNLSVELAEDVTDSITADKIILIVIDAEKEMIQKIMRQFSYSQRIQGIITVTQLEHWYTKALAGKFNKELGETILKNLRNEFAGEFPTNTEMIPFLKERKYDKIKLDGNWKVD